MSFSTKTLFNKSPWWAKATPTIYNVTLTDADTEYSQALPANCKAFSVSIIAGDSAENLRVAFVTGKVATPTAPYYQIPADQEYTEYGLDLASATLYVASSEAAKVAQIIAWT